MSDLDDVPTPFDYAPGAVIRWQVIPGIDEPTPPLADQLASRPGRWALVAESVPTSRDLLRTDAYRPLADEDRFELYIQEVDDGPCGVLYDMFARTRPSTETDEPTP